MREVRDAMSAAHAEPWSTRPAAGRFVRRPNHRYPGRFASRRHDGQAMTGRERAKRVARHGRPLAASIVLAVFGLPVAPAATTGCAATVAPPAALHEFEVALPVEVQAHVKRSPVAHARITIGVPDDIEVTSDTPVLVVSATADPGYDSSRRLLRLYADAAMASGWIVVAADPSEDVAAEDDDVSLRLLLDLAALAVLERQWPAARDAPLAFGGFSGGAKFSGWLAAAFAAQGHRVVGVYLAGINQDTLVAAATQFKVDAAFKRIPVFLQAGQDDDVATPTDHRDVAARLKRAGFEHVRLVSFDGSHEVDPAPLGEALRWFREIAAKPITADGPMP